ncbi:hypothetical protein [Pontibacter cellulosilyticus]|uniref:STAS/SEC14 domain-containing protein n=1 Tax=Pontibacter cellulosilyticus TaxID=1720253 RepID=A0A923N3M8_9BACT|nr:hypothetical protein [Pontibacter cellulosilyticus]MBC5991888.1 hypothetical protein [Pontibacter cellulosilyticus]
MMSENFLTLSFSPKTNFITAQWLRPVSSQEYRHGIRIIAVCITTLKAQFALSDFSKIDTPPIDDQYCTANFLKTALQGTSLKRCARVLSGSASQLEAYQRVMAEATNLPYQTNGFNSVEEAKRWLLESEQNCETEHVCDVNMATSSQILRKTLQQYAGKAGLNYTKLAPDNGAQVIDTGLEVLCNTDFLKISMDNCNSLVAMRWLQPVQSLDYRHGIQTMCHTLSQHQPEKLIIFNQRLGVISLPDQMWFSNRFVEVVSANRTRRIAVVTSQDSLQLLVHEAIDKNIKSKNQLYDPGYFFSEDEAMEWLMLKEHYKHQN